MFIFVNFLNEMFTLTNNSMLHMLFYPLICLKDSFISEYKELPFSCFKCSVQNIGNGYALVTPITNLVTSLLMDT